MCKIGREATLVDKDSCFLRRLNRPEFEVVEVNRMQEATETRNTLLLTSFRESKGDQPAAYLEGSGLGVKTETAGVQIWRQGPLHRKQDLGVAVDFPRGFSASWGFSCL